MLGVLGRELSPPEMQETPLEGRNQVLSPGHGQQCVSSLMGCWVFRWGTLVAAEDPHLCLAWMRRHVPV